MTSIQPGRPGSFFKGDAQISDQPVDELHNSARIGLDDTFHHHLADGVPHGDRNTFRMYVHMDGLWRVHHRTKYHEGGDPGFAAFEVRYPDLHVVIIVMANKDDSPVREIADAIARHLFGD